MEKAITPQKRDKNLVPLSREHHFGLLFCWKIRQGLKNGTDLYQIRAYVRYFWNNILKEHCAEEEWMLKRLLKADDVVKARLEEEHKLLQALIGLIEKGSKLNKELFEVLAQDLTDHIRWEERELFPYLQDVTNPDDLELAGQLLTHKHDPRLDNFTPEFWAVKARAIQE
ncbi:hemerythrin domain-containing protein [Pontibacter sp. H259]|uniref:hemerythrin domain-containing protein n=1 Tax=Pontibacter sp. H259 TaxID=3133421 RepID=UPI0030BC0289